MDVLEISAEQFYAGVPDWREDSAFVEDLGYFSALDGWYLGVLYRDRGDQAYSYAVLGPDGAGARRWIGGRSLLDSDADAHHQLVGDLEDFAIAGKRIFPR